MLSNLRRALLASLFIFTTAHSGLPDNYPDSGQAAPIHNHFVTPTAADKKLWSEIKASGLLFEKADRTFVQMISDLVRQHDPYLKAQKKVNRIMREEYGAKQRTITTQDGEQVSTLIRTVPNAKITLVYVTGYFVNQTPTKEWVAPFYKIFPDCNIVSFDWRSAGESSGTFSHNAIYDVHAMLNLCKTDPVLKKSKVVLKSFCLGGALALESLMPLIKANSAIMPDAYVMSCTPSVVADLRKAERAVGLAPNKVIKLLAQVGFTRRFMINKFLDPAIQNLAPVYSLPYLRIPVCFEYCAKRDSCAPLQDCNHNYHAAANAPVRHVIVSEPAGHVRLHKETPDQYRQAYHEFFARAGLFQSARTVV